MARSAAPQSVTSAIEEVVLAVVERVLPGIQRAINRAVDGRLRAEGKVARRGRSAGKPMRPRVDITRWVADKRGRRVPNFVIRATGLKTKKAVVAKFGANAAFVKGKPLPAVNAEVARRAVPQASSTREVRAKPPLVRKHAAVGE